MGNLQHFSRKLTAQMHQISIIWPFLVINELIISMSTVLLGKKHKKMSEKGEIYTTGKNFTLPPAVMAGTNSTSVGQLAKIFER